MRRITGTVELTKMFDGMPKGTRGEIFGERILFHPEKMAPWVPIYDCMLVNLAWWLDTVKITGGPMAEIASEVLKEGD